MRVIIALIGISLVLCSCPNNCSNHGKCKSDGTCVCDEGQTAGSGSGAIYMGADCSMKICPKGESYGAVLYEGLPNPSQSYRRALEIMSAENEERKLQSTDVKKRELSVPTISQKSGSYYTVSGVEYKLLSKNRGELMCYSELGEYKGKVQIVGKMKNSEDSYMIKLPSTIKAEDFLLYDCRVSFQYNDLSLINPVISADNKVTWVGMKDILNEVGIEIETNDVYFACRDENNGLKPHKTDAAPPPAPEIRMLAEGENDIVFNFPTNPPADGLMCFYLGKAAADDKSDGKTLLDASDISKVSSLLLTDGIDIGLGDKKMYKIYYKEPLPSKKYALLNCYDKYTNDLIGKTYLMGYANNIAKVVYDFDEIIYDPYDLKCEIIEEYDEVTSLYAMKVEPAADGSFTNAGVKEVIDGLQNNVDALVLGCYNPTSYEFTTYSYKYTAADNKFTPATTSDGGSSDSTDRRNLNDTRRYLSVKRRNLAEVAKPAKGDICYISVSGNDFTNGASFVSKHLILTGENDKYKYFDENSIVYLPGERKANNIYILENITFITGTSGALIECTNMNNNNNIVQIQILYKITDVNKYYVRYNNNKIGSGEYKCELIHSTSDLSLYELSKPKDCITESGKETKCDLTMSSMSNFLPAATINVNNNYDVVKIACSRGDSIEIYKYEYTAPTTAPNPDEQPDEQPAKRLLNNENEDVVFTIDKSSESVPSNNDICHIISYKEKETTKRRIRRLSDDVDELKASDYGKSLSNYIYKPSKSIEVDIGKMNHKVYEVNNINIIPEGIDSYIGRISCKYSNNEGIGYLMGKSINGYMILFDFVNENTIPLINSYNCKLSNIYSDLSLYYGNTIKNQSSNGVGECYGGKCDLIWKGMNSLLSKVTLGKDQKVGDALGNLKSANPLNVICMNKAKKVAIYKYEGNQLDDNDLKFSIVGDNSYPLIGHICNILSKLDGEVLDSDGYKSLALSEYVINPPNGAKLPPTLMSYDSVVADKIFKVRRFSPTPSSIGYSVCTKAIEVGQDTIIAINYGKIKSETSIDSYFIEYADKNGDAITPTPSPESYSCGKFTYYEDVSSIIKVTPTSCNDQGCQITLAEGYMEILENLGYTKDGEKYLASFACYSNNNELKSYEYQSTDGVKFDIQNGAALPNPSSECSLLLNKEGKTIKLKDSEIYKSPRLLLGKKETINNIDIYNGVNIDLKFSSGLGISKCYNKYSGKYIGNAILYGKDKSNENEYLVGYSSGINIKKLELYNCKSFEEYSDLSMLFTFTLPSECTDATKCVITITGIKPLLSNYLDIDTTTDYSVGCEAGDELLEYKLTSDNNLKYTTPPKAIRQLESELTLYIKNEGNSDDVIRKVGNIKKCHLLLDREGKTIEMTKSDMYKFPIFSDKISKEDNPTFYTYYIYNLDFPSDYKSGKMTCYDESKDLNTEDYKIDLLVYYKVEDKNIYEVQFGDGKTAVTDFSKYNCKDAVQFNDLSLINPSKVTAADPSKITWSKMSRILGKIGFYNGKSDSDSIINTRFVCIKNSDNSVYYATSSVTYARAMDTEDNDIIFTLAEIKPTPITPAVNDECYLLSSFDGVIIDDVADSDVGKKLGLTEDTKNIPKADNPIAIPSIGSGKVFKVSNVEYTLNNNIIINQCYDKSNNYLGESYVLSKDDTDSSNVFYYIYYSWITKDETANPTANPIDYSCIESGKYSDLSLITEVTIKSTDNCDIKLEGMSPILTSMKFTSKDVVYQFICINSRKELYLYNYTTTDDGKTFKIEGSSKTVPYIGDKCNLLATTTGTTVKLSESEYGKKNNIFTDNPNGEKQSTSDNKVETVETESIPEEIPKSGGILKCYDKESGKYVGTIEVIGKKSNGEAIIKYNIQTSILDISESDLDINLFDTEVDSVRKDLSLVNPPTVPSTCVNNPNNCKLIWKYMGSILSDSNLLLERMRELKEKSIDFMCPDTGGVYKEVKFSYDDDSDINKNGDLTLTYKSGPKDFKFQNNTQCNALIDGEGYKVELKNTEFYVSVKINENGDPVLSTATVDPHKVNNVYQITVNGKVDDFAGYLSKKQIPVPIEDSVDGRNLYSEISLGRTVVISCSGCTTTSKVIIGIERNVEIKVETTPTTRLLFENERMLDQNTYNGVILQFDEVNSITGLSGATTSYTLSFPKTPGAAHTEVECSGVGTCDRESGECKCYNGFTGSACERMDCPNNCNNHGKCVNYKELTSKLDDYKGYGIERVFGCKCDSGYRGADCSLKECPSDEKSKDRDCSNHGLCDYSDGSCKCFDGYYGEACQYSIGTA